MKADIRQFSINVGAVIFAASTIGMLGFLCWGLIYQEISLNNKDALMLALGVILAKYSDIAQFFFGSSSAAKKQTETVDKLVETNRKAQEAVLPPSTAIPLAEGERVTVEGKSDK